jgi:hypothetical protein
MALDESIWSHFIEGFKSHWPHYKPVSLFRPIVYSRIRNAN